MGKRDADDVPHIGRGRLRPRFPLAQLIQIFMLIVALVAVLMLRQSCASGVATWFNTVAPPVTVDAGSR